MKILETKQHTLTTFDEKLNNLTEDMVNMGQLVRESVAIAGRSLVDPDESLLKEVRDNDLKINALDEHIQYRVTEIIALMNPMAVDLRFITSALKIAISLERAGDLAKNITKRMVRLKVSIPEAAKEKMEEMVPIVISMMDAALEAVRNKSIDEAKAVWRTDDDADDLCRDVLNVIREEMTKNPETAQYLADVMFAAKNFERLADYATNIAKTVYYVTSGETPPKEETIKN